MSKESVLRVTRNDCKWDYFRVKGPGGQKVNKNSVGVRCVHSPSGAKGECSEFRSQLENRKIAFRRMAESSEFEKWWRIESARIMGLFVKSVEEVVEEQMKENNLLVEIKENGRWVMQ